MTVRIALKNKKIKAIVFKFLPKKLQFSFPGRIYLNSKKGVKTRRFFSRRMSALKLLKFQCNYFKDSIFNKILFSVQKLKEDNKILKFLSKLSRKVDVVLFQAGFCSSKYVAKQLISHKKVYINDRPLRSSNYLLKRGDILSLDTSIIPELKTIFFLNNLKKFYSIDHLEINYNLFKMIVLSNTISTRNSILTYSQKPKYTLLF